MADEELSARLTASSRGAARSASPDEVAALRRYQGLDRAYQMVNEVLRGRRRPEDLTDDEREVVESNVAGLTRLLRR